MNFKDLVKKNFLSLDLFSVLLWEAINFYVPEYFCLCICSSWPKDAVNPMTPFPNSAPFPTHNSASQNLGICKHIPPYFAHHSYPVLFCFVLFSESTLSKKDRLESILYSVLSSGGQVWCHTEKTCWK